MAKTISQINEKIKKGKVVVVTAEELKVIAKKKTAKEIARDIDVVTTATFGPMCSSGAYFNIGHFKPKVKLGGDSVRLNGVEAYAGFAAADLCVGATALPANDPRNKIYPGTFSYGGGHVIEDLVSGKNVKLEASAYGTDCYPGRSIDTFINIRELQQATLFNMRNMYQNYNVAVNLSPKIIYTYMGALRPELGNANYCSAGELSPLLNDPSYRTIGIGTRIFLGGGTGYICWWGTQHNPNVKKTKDQIPLSPAGTAAVIGDLKQMSPEWLKGTSFRGYGATLSVGIGVPIPLLDEELAKRTSITDDKIFTQVVDYSKAYPQGTGEILGRVSYAELKTGNIKLRGRNVPAAGISSYFKAKKICEILKKRIAKGKFFLSDPVDFFPGSQRKTQTIGKKQRGG